MASGERAEAQKLSPGEISDAMYRVGWAARGLSVLDGGARSAIPQLTTFMISDDSGTVRFTADVLKGFGPDGARAIVVGLTNKDRGARLETAQALGDLGTNVFSVVPEIFQSMDRLEEQAAADCASAIEGSGAPIKTIMAGFIEKLHSTNANCRMVSTWSLGRLGTNAVQAVTCLQELQSDPDKDVRIGAKKALIAIKRR